MPLMIPNTYVLGFHSPCSPPGAYQCPYGQVLPCAIEELGMGKGGGIIAIDIIFTLTNEVWLLHSGSNFDLSHSSKSAQLQKESFRKIMMILHS